MTTAVKTSLERYCPEIDLANVSMWETMKLVELLTAVRTMIGAATSSKGRSAPVVQYLDDWASLILEATQYIGDAAELIEPRGEAEMRARNWLLANLRLQASDDLVQIVGPGAAPFCTDEYSAGLIATRAKRRVA